MKKLSKEEMKMVMGGVLPPGTYSCSCDDQIGTWEYNSEPGDITIAQDVIDYCHSGNATCGPIHPI